MLAQQGCRTSARSCVLQNCRGPQYPCKIEHRSSRSIVMIYLSRSVGYQSYFIKLCQSSFISQQSPSIVYQSQVDKSQITNRHHQQPMSNHPPQSGTKRLLGGEAQPTGMQKGWGAVTPSPRSWSIQASFQTLSSVSSRWCGDSPSRADYTSSYCCLDHGC